VEYRSDANAFISEVVGACLTFLDVVKENISFNGALDERSL
jgi:hypothetical protein